MGRSGSLQYGHSLSPGEFVSPTRVSSIPTPSTPTSLRPSHHRPRPDSTETHGRVVVWRDVLPTSLRGRERGEPQWSSTSSLRLSLHTHDRSKGLGPPDPPSTSGSGWDRTGLVGGLLRSISLTRVKVDEVTQASVLGATPVDNRHLSLSEILGVAT